ncbi:MAG: Crp/Fnr family transcriptional regulator [Bacteroidota bacterium]
MEQLRAILSEHVSLSEEAWQAIKERSYLRKLPLEAFFTASGEPVREVAYVTHGLLRSFYLEENGAEWNEKFIQPGDFMVANVNPEEPSKVFIQALEDTAYIGIQYADYVQLTERYPEIALVMHKVTAQSMSLKQDRLMTFMAMNARDRYTYFREIYAEVADRIPQYHVSSYLGITPTQLSRLRKEIAANQQM